MIPELLLEKAKAKGSDAEYQAYVRRFPSVLTNDYKAWVDGEPVSEYSHERDVSDGAGVAIKPDYSGLPLTHEQHRNCHQHGQSYYNPPEWWYKKKVEMLTKWINGSKPPVLPEKRTKETYIVESANHLNALREMLEGYFQNPKAKPIEVTISTGKKRSSSQNSGMWAAIYGDILAFYATRPDALAKDVVEYVLTHQPSNNFIHELMKGLCNDGKSTASLKVQEHCNYFDRIAQRFIEKHEHEVKMPVNTKGYNEFY